MFALRLFRAALMLALVLFVTEATIIVVAQLPETTPTTDVFAPLAPLMPGQPMSALQYYPYTCGQVTAIAVIICQIDLREISIGQVNVYVHDVTIQSLSLEDTGLRVGDLILRWGYPDRVRRLGDRVEMMTWGGNLSITVFAAENFNYFRPVTSILFR